VIDTQHAVSIQYQSRNKNQRLGYSSRLHWDKVIINFKILVSQLQYLLVDRRFKCIIGLIIEVDYVFLSLVDGRLQLFNKSFIFHKREVLLGDNIITTLKNGLVISSYTGST